jgi:hypothetical protein
MSPNFDQQLQQGSEDAAELNRQVKALDQQLQDAPTLDEILKNPATQANQGQPLSLPEVEKQQQYLKPENCPPGEEETNDCQYKVPDAPSLIPQYQICNSRTCWAAAAAMMLPRI